MRGQLRHLVRRLPLVLEAGMAETACRPASHALAGFSGRDTWQPWQPWQCVPLASMHAIRSGILQSKPEALTTTRLVDVPRNNSLFTRAVLFFVGYHTRESQLIRGARGQLYAILEQVADPTFRSTMQLPEGEFFPTYMAMSLHMWMLLVRLRTQGRDGRRQMQMLYEQFQEEVTSMVKQAGVKVRVIKQLQELEKMFYGSSMAYDKALKGEEPLHTAFLRNVYGNEEASKPTAATLERYVLRELQCLAMTPAEDVLAGQLRFTPLGHVATTENNTTREGDAAPVIN